MMSHFDRLAAIQLDFIEKNTLTAHQIQFCFQQLKTSDERCITIAADILAGLDEPVIANLISLFPELSDYAQLVLVPLLCCCDYTMAYTFLLDTLVDCTSPELKDILAQSLSHSSFPIFPFILNRLQRPGYDSAALTPLLTLIPFRLIKPYLLALPAIPQEQLFRRIFGDDSIDSIKNAPPVAPFS